MARCHECGVEIELDADVCERHAMTHEQTAEMIRRMWSTAAEYKREIWPDLRRGS